MSSHAHLSPDELFRKLITAAALAGKHAEHDFYEAERELYGDPHMREAREIKEELLHRLETASRDQGASSEQKGESPVIGSFLPQSSLDLNSISGKEF